MADTKPQVANKPFVSLRQRLIEKHENVFIPRAANGNNSKESFCFPVFLLGIVQSEIKRQVGEQSKGLQATSPTSNLMIVFARVLTFVS